MTAKRTPNAAERRQLLCDSAIHLLAEHGLKGLSHLKVDRYAGLPDGTTSFYFRTREALLHATADRVSELDWQDLSSATDSQSPLTRLAVTLVSIGEEPHLSRTKARYELLLHATRAPELSDRLQRSVARFDGLCRQVVTEFAPAESPLVDDLSYALSTFLNGAIVGLIYGARDIGSVARAEKLLDAVITGVLTA